MPLVLHGQAEMTLPPAIVHASSTDDTYARIDRLEQRGKQIKVSDGVTN